MININHLSVKYSHQSELALDNINLSTTDSAITGIIGPNGAGKSTLFKAILQLLTYQGEILIDGQVPHKQLSKIAYVEQKNQIDLNFPITVKECVSLGAFPNLNLFKPIPKHIWLEVERALSEVGLAHQQNKPLACLSGGQLQRVLLARCLVQNAKYLLLDEPFVGVDSVSEDIIIKILKRLAKDGHSIMIVHHDMNTVEDYFDQLLMINRQLIASGPTKKVWNQANLSQTFGRYFLMKEEAIV